MNIAGKCNHIQHLNMQFVLVVQIGKFMKHFLHFFVNIFVITGTFFNTTEANTAGSQTIF